MNSPLHIQVADGIAELLLNHPPVNGLTPELMDELMSALRRLGDDPEVRVIILGSALPGRFCGGLGYRAGAAGAVDLINAVFGTHDCQEGLTAFAEKRKPVWSSDKSRPVAADPRRQQE